MEEQQKTLQLSPNPAPHHHHRVLLYGLAALFLIIIAGGIGYIWARNNNPPINSISQIQNQQKLIPSPSPSILPFPSIQPIDTSQWKLYTSTNSNFTMRYPPTFVTKNVATYEGGASEKWLADSIATLNIINNPIYADPTKNHLPQNSIIIYPLGLNVGNDTAGHTQDEILEKIVNQRAGVSTYVPGSANVPWVNANGGTYDGRKVFMSTSSYAKGMINGKLAARITHIGYVSYIILNKDNYVELTAQPDNSTYINTFDVMVSTLSFQ